MKLLIENAKLLTMTPDSPERGFVLVEDGQIQMVGHGSCPAEAANGAQYFDAFGRVVMPGMIDAHCHLGLFNSGLRWEGEDGNEITDPITPDLSAVDSIFPDDIPVSEASRYGITSVMTGPGSANVIGGTFAHIHTHGRTVEDMLISEKPAMKAAFGENPKSCYGQNQKSPGTRMSSAAHFRRALDEACWYKKQKELKPEETKPDARWEALLPVLSGERLIKIHCHRMDDILTAVRLADQYGLRFTLDHCSEGYLIADVLKKYYDAHRGDDCGKGEPGRGKLVGIITGPLMTDRSKPELNRASITNPAVLAETGIPVAIATDHPVIPIEYLPVTAAMAVRAGMPEYLALQAITSNAALCSDAGDYFGRIAPGYVADLLVLSGEPFDYRTTPDLVLIAGDMVHQRR